MSEYICEPLAKRHDRSEFVCDESALNDYLAKYASQDVKRKVAAVFVMVKDSNPKRVVGYYTLCATSVMLSALPANITKQLPKYPEIPAILIGRLARDQAYPGIGSLLLSDAITRCVRSSTEIAASLIVVDSKGEQATRFYKRYGFLSLPNLPNRMFLPIQTADKL
jgi:predicted GNAT family N-acyltransferase